LNSTLSYLGGLASGAVSVWFFFWVYRRKYELDYKLDKTAQTMRWLIVLFGFAIALIPGPQFKIPRIIAGVMLVAFLAWPNFAHHLTVLFRRPTEGQKGY
jgi:hypothetical protein